MKGLALCAMALAGGASIPASVLAQPPTIADPAAFLVQLRCPDGKLEVAETACPGAAPQTASDPMLMRRRDWPPPKGYVIFDAIVGPYGPETIWSEPPFGPFVAAHGDGGEVYVVEGPTVRAALTQDGGTPWLQGFYGAHCGGTGWIVFRTDAPTGRWASLVAALSDARVPGPCSAGGAALTRYRLEDVAAPWIIGGVRRTLTRATVITEHYDHASLGASVNMERSFFAKGVGRIIWEAWTRGQPASKDIAERCPGAAWSAPPAPGWVLSDCRYATNVTAADGAMSGAKFNWPGPGLGTLP